MGETDERLPSQIEAEAEALKLIEEAQSFQNNPPQYEVEARQRQINEAWARASPSATPAPAQPTSISPRALGILHPGGDFSAREEDITLQQPVAPRPTDWRLVRRLLGPLAPSEWQSQHWEALQAGKRRRLY